VPAADFSADELIYLPRNLRAHRLYGMSPVEQIALTVNLSSGATPRPQLLPRRLDA
jgi:phage portal protein BeeE